MIKGNPTRQEVCKTLNCSSSAKPKACEKDVNFLNILINLKQIRTLLRVLAMIIQASLFSGGGLMNFHSYGKWVDGCGKFFMFSTEKVCNYLKFLSTYKIAYFLGNLDSSP
jgi:hypothetical protein